jgi:hypothetical protein
MINRIDPTWRDDSRSNINHDVRFYISPRQKTFYPYHINKLFFRRHELGFNLPGSMHLYSGTAQYNIDGFSSFITFDMQLKLNVAYNASATILQIDDTTKTKYLRLVYNSTTSSAFTIIYYNGSTSTTVSSTAFTSDAESRRWLRIGFMFDVSTGALKIRYNQTEASTTFALGGSFDTLLCTFYGGNTFFSDCKMIQANTTLAQHANGFKTYTDNEYYWSFNGHGLGYERCNITRFVLDYNVAKSKNFDAGGVSANELSISLKSLNGEFADDQYNTFSPSIGSYNGEVTQKYLTNRLPVWVEDHYYRTPIAWLGQQAFYQFEEAQGTRAVDSFAGNKHGTWVWNFSTLQNYAKGKFGRGVDLTISPGSEYATITSLMSGTKTELTVAGWVKLDSFGGVAESRVIMQNWNTDSPGSQDGFALRLLNDSVYPSFTVCDGTDDHTVTSSVALTTGTWYHVLGVFKAGSHLKIYVNGVEAGSQLTLPTQYSTETTFYIGYSPLNAGQMDGSLDEIFVADRALSTTEITTLYQGFYTESFNDIVFRGRTELNAFQRTSSVSDITTVAITATDDMSIMANARTVESIAFSDYLLAANICNTDYLDTSITTGLQGFWRFDDNTGTSAVDSSGNSRTATLSGAAWSEGLRNACVSFDGINDYVSVPHNAAFAPASALTVSAWAYNESWSTAAGSIVSKHEGNGGWRLDCAVTLSSKLSFTIYRGGNISVTYLLSKLRSGWNHFVGHYDGQYLSLYVNNILVDQYNFGSSGNIAYVNNNSVIIGADAGTTTTPSGNYFSGKIDEVKIYNAALSRENIEFTHNIGSFFHEIIKEGMDCNIKNYLCNSSFENATITNSWANGVRSSTYALIGTYANVPASGATGSFQWVNFVNPIPQNYQFTFYIWAYSTGTSTITIKLGESTAVGGSLTETSVTVSGLVTADGWYKIPVTHTIVSKSSTVLKCTMSYTGSSVYFDMAHLVNSKIDYDLMIINTADSTTAGANPTSTYTQAVNCDLQTVGIMADLIAYTLPYGVFSDYIELKQMLNDLDFATIAQYLGCLSCGAFDLTSELGSAYIMFSDDSIDSASNVATSQGEQYNKILIKGAMYNKQSLIEAVWNLKNSGFRNYATDGLYAYPVLAGGTFPNESLHGELWADYEEVK